MTQDESEELIDRTAKGLSISNLLSPEYVQAVIAESQGHPYVIKMLVGEVAKERKAGNVRRIVAGREEVLTALFERTYASLSPAARRVFLTLAGWNSAVPRIALEAVMLRPANELIDVEEAVESLVQSSMAEVVELESESESFVSLPFVASVFGKKKLNVSPLKTAVQADIEILQMLGVAKGQDGSAAFAKRIEEFFRSVAKRISGKSDLLKDYEPMLEMICRNYNPGWKLLARLCAEEEGASGLEKAKEANRRFLEGNTSTDEAAEAWRALAHLCYRTGDALGEIHAFIERCQLSTVPFHDLADTANHLNQMLREQQLQVDREEKTVLAARLLEVLEGRITEADADDLSRMGWLALHLNQPMKAFNFARAGLRLNPQNYHCTKLSERLRA